MLIKTDYISNPPPPPSLKPWCELFVHDGQVGEQGTTEEGLEEGPVGSSMGLGHPTYFSRESAVQLSQFRLLPHCYRPLLPALFPILYSLDPSFCPQSQN